MSDGISPVFAPTRWSLVLRARGDSPEAHAALSELCAAYCDPVLRCLRNRGFDEDRAREISHDFLAHLLAGERLEGADPARGRFRSYLLGALKHFLSDARERAARHKRGGGIEVGSLNNDIGCLIADPGSVIDDRQFDRDWAVSLMARAMDVLGREYADVGRTVWFEQLQPWLAGTEPPSRQSDVATQLHLTEGALKVAIHRLRKRFREIIRQEIRQTLPEGGDADEELRYLVEVLASG